MTITLFDAARQALTALSAMITHRTSFNQARGAVAALRTAIEAAEKVEPVAPDDTKVICPACCHQFRAVPPAVQSLMLDAGFLPPFNTPPAERKPLTAEQVAQCIVEARVNGPFARAGTTSFRIARAVERAHGIGGSNE